MLLLTKMNLPESILPNKLSCATAKEREFANLKKIASHETGKSIQLDNRRANHYHRISTCALLRGVVKTNQMQPTIQEIIDKVKSHYQDWWPEPTGKNFVDEFKTFNIRGYEVDVLFSYTASEEYIKKDCWLIGSYINETICVFEEGRVIESINFPDELITFFNEEFHFKYEAD